MSRSPDSSATEPLYRISCTACGRTYDVRIEDLTVCQRSEADIKAHQTVTTFAWR
jgi:predicted nucleic acid-binding Zn ribbon protein